MATTNNLQVPVVEDGIRYWTEQPASVDGVLVSASYRCPWITSLFASLVPRTLYRIISIKALGSTARVQSNPCIGCWSRKPVTPFIQEALQNARKSAAANSSTQTHGRHAVHWPGLAEQTKSVTFLQGTLQAFDPAHPIVSNDSSSAIAFIDRIGSHPSPEDPMTDIDSGFDVVWCQWCLGHLNDIDLVAFLRRSYVALRDHGVDGHNGKSLIVVKENACSDAEDGGPKTVFDEQDSSFTRSDMAWKAAFREAGLRLVKEQVQEGLPDGLYVVKMYALK
ncbi:methyltransferase domain-containing protein [Lentinula edodes]|uniref:Alpha N-terminal protein methyltransferase 1 n=1 Tax=Lentinula edodes TaxID=5353 RepID=A0A1Q3ESG3_LENED|nr:methyltransferase domain-containing protein [Lentinula edodes]